MKQAKTDIIVAGNGLSRKFYDFNAIKGALKCPLFACNLAWKDLPYDSLFAIDDQIIKELRNKKIEFVDVPDDMKWEPEEINYPYRARNNTGMVAIQWAINLGYKKIHIFGFDFLLPTDQEKLSNVFAGHPLYGPETACSVQDSYGRAKYLSWMIDKNKDVEFKFYFPEKYETV